jgi:regulator of protease activity HflC (stomatin/prohibitin superfamily)
MKVSVQFKVIQEKVYDAFYKLEYPHDQITAYVFDVVRAEVPKLKLDDVFERKDDIAIAVKRELNEAMMTYGYDIINTLVTDIDPDLQVKNAMNRINAADREKTAAEFEAESSRIRIVAKAKAEAESKRLQGQGIADQRREIAGFGRKCRGFEQCGHQLTRSFGADCRDATLRYVASHWL